MTMDVMMLTLCIRQAISSLSNINKKHLSLQKLNDLLTEIDNAQTITDTQLERFASIIFSPGIQNLTVRNKRKKKFLNDLKKVALIFLDDLNINHEHKEQIASVLTLISDQGRPLLDRDRLNHDDDFIDAVHHAQKSYLLPWNNEVIRSKVFNLIEGQESNKKYFVMSLIQVRNALAQTRLWRNIELRTGIIIGLLDKLEKEPKENRTEYLNNLEEAFVHNKKLLSGSLGIEVFNLLRESQEPIDTSNSLSTLNNLNLLNKETIKIYGSYISVPSDKTDHINDAINLLNECSRHNRKLFQMPKKDQSILLRSILNHTSYPKELAALVLACYKNDFKLIKEKSIFKQLTQIDAPTSEFRNFINNSKLKEREKNRIKIDKILQDAKRLLYETPKKVALSKFGLFKEPPPPYTSLPPPYSKK